MPKRRLASSTRRPASTEEPRRAPRRAHLPAPPPLPRGAPEGCRFDHAAAEAACAFFPEYLCHTEAEWAGQPFHLAPWQRAIVRALFGWKRPDGARLYRQAYIEVPRKNGKTEFGAGLALLLLLGDGEYGGQVYALACDKDQAKIAFNKATIMVGFSPKLSGIIEAYKTSLFCPQLMASFKPLSSAPNTKQGFSPTGAISDEVHAWPDGELADVVHKGTAARRQPLEIYITTAGVFGQGFGWELHDRATKIIDGTITDPTFLAVIHAATPEDDWTNETVWARANPNLGTTVKLDYMRAECQAALENPRKENEFKRYHLNIWTSSFMRWLPMPEWDGPCRGPVGWQALAEHLAGRRCFVGTDLSTRNDITAVVYVFPPPDDAEEEEWWAIPRLFVPEENMRLRVRRDRVPYDIWARDGALMLTEGNVIDYRAIESQIVEDARRFEIVEIAYDPWNATQWALGMQDQGFSMVEFRQGPKSYNEPCLKLEALVSAGRLYHGGHPVLRWMANNVSIRSDVNDNIAPDKKRSSERIDGIVALLEALGRAIVTTREERSQYLTQSFTFA